tara:strand:+ start:256 stop:540 length:285 start_codon:yes stop_codon:yes gene_type:complete
VEGVVYEAQKYTETRRTVAPATARPAAISSRTLPAFDPTIWKMLLTSAEDVTFPPDKNVIALAAEFAPTKLLEMSDPMAKACPMALDIAPSRGN